MKPILVIMAAGLGSRFGGNKQITKVDPEGQLIIDYSVFDAVRAGFGKVIFVIKKESEADFRAAIGDRIAPYVKVEYAYQELTDLPEGFSVPEGRVKPWGTAHAMMAARDLIDAPFAIINADDFYGRGAFEQAAKYLTAEHKDTEHAMVAYRVENTLTENGSVSRGVCETENGVLTNITERTKIVPAEGGAKFIEDDGETFLPNGTPVSMNFWLFFPSVVTEARKRFADFLTKNLPVNPLKCEYYLPSVPKMLIDDGAATVTVLDTDERWYGVTYREDLEKVQKGIADMKAAGVYPNRLW